MSERRHKPAQAPERPSELLKAFEKHHSALKRFIARYLSSHHDIEDVAQESFLRAFRAGMNYKIQQPKSFLFRIAKNVAISQLRSKSRQITDSIEEHAVADVMVHHWTLEDDVIARERLGMQCDAVATLPPRCRRVYILRKVHGMSHQEIAERLGISKKTVGKHLYKGIAACDLYLRENLNTDSLEQSSQTLGRPMSAVRTKEGKAHG